MVKVFYRARVVELKRADGRKRRARSVIISVLEALPLLALFLLWGSRSFSWTSGAFAGIVLYFLAAWLFLPNPFLQVPDEYTITLKGIMIGGIKRLILKKGTYLRVNEERRFVSICHRYKGEAVRLYTPEPKKVVTALQQIKRDW